MASRLRPGRFNSDQVAALYLAREAPTALEEFRSTEDGRQADDCVISIVQFSVKRVVDFTDPAVLDEWRLKAQDLAAADVARCQRVASLAAAAGWEAIQWPSATGRGASLAVFLEHLSPESTLELLRVIDPPAGH